ncbi:MAG: type IX secretion system outer membrane channel protein PorV [Cyclobacteriaceae bacterium]
MPSLLFFDDWINNLPRQIKFIEFYQFKKLLPLLFIFSLCDTPSYSQGSVSCEQLTAFDFLLIAPDAAAAGRGETGVATSADNNSGYYNMGKLSFNQSTGGVSLSYTPWLKKIFDGASLSYLSGFWKPTDEQAISAAITYFNLGNLQDNSGLAGGNNRSFALGYSRKIGDKVGIGLTAKYTQADYNFDGSINSAGFSPDNSVAFDLGFYYQNDFKQLENWQYSIGIAVSNIGSKVDVASSGVGDFLSTNLRLGGAVEWASPNDYVVTWAIDLNKLLVPSCTNGFSTRSAAGGMLHSFGDAPGGFSEELQEIILNTGLEIWVSQTLAARIGYSHQSRDKGQQTYFTMGLGGHLSSFTADLAYYLPRDSNHPFRETLRFSLGFELN